MSNRLPIVSTIESKGTTQILNAYGITMGCDPSKDVNPNAAKGYILEKFTKHRRGVNCMIMEPDKYIMATGGEDKSAILWRINTTPTQSKAILRGHGDYIECLTFHDKFVLTGNL